MTAADAQQAPQTPRPPTLDPPPVEPDPEPQPTVGSKVGNGVLWSLLNTAVLRLGILVSGIALARILTTEDYGVFGVAAAVLIVLHAFNELGVSLALVRWERDVREFAPTAMTISVGTSAVLYAALFATAPVICDLMGSPTSVPVVQVLCVAVILDGIASVPSTILNREFKQRTRFFCDALAFVVVTGLTISLALSGAGAMSFAIGQVAGNVVSVVCYLLLCPIKVRPGWDKAIARELLVFGLPLAAASVLTLSVMQIDKFVVGPIAGTVALGLYMMVFNQSSLPLQIFSEAARRVSLAGFARLADDKPQLEQSVARGVGLLVAGALPVCALLGCYAAPMLHIVYGEQWVPGAAALQFLAVLGLVRIVLFIGYDLLVALDGNKALIGLQALWLGAVLPALIIGTHLDGIRGAAIAQATVATLVVLPSFAIVIRRRGVRLMPSVLACVRPVVGGVLLVASTIVVRSVFTNPWLQVGVGGLAAAVLYLPVVYPMRKMLPGKASA
ncbi:lipopolysaccharide biosynthesis protein [Actinokineospora inagensis]|uniref:lipopolysaccharide biosynthesis protein n=1 Tax=Actinokineospora inagensis TaxID=103730 RepID=UPI0004052DB2|nr:lipopolysaccharide biosynthesis protein [Actinokineospora inagensis]